MSETVNSGRGRVAGGRAAAAGHNETTSAAPKSSSNAAQKTAAKQVADPSSSAKNDDDDEQQSASTTAPSESDNNRYALAMEMRKTFTRLQILGYPEYHLQNIRGRPLSQLYFAERNPSGDPFMAFARVATWLLRKCGAGGDASSVLHEPTETDDPNELAYNIVEQSRKVLNTTNDSFKPYKLKSGYGEEVIKLLTLLSERAMQLNVQLLLPTYPTGGNAAADGGADDDTVEEIRTGALLGGSSEGDHAADSSDEDDEATAAAVAGEYNINASAARNNNQEQNNAQTRFTGKGETDTMQMPAMSDEDWRAEVERVQHKLKVIIRPDNRDWRSHIEQLRTLTGEINTLGKSTGEQLGKLAAEIGKTHDKLTSREKYVNKQLSDVIGKYRNSRQKLQDIRSRGRDGRQAIEDKLEKINRYDEQIDELKRKIEEKTTEMTDRNSITTFKVAMKRLKEEINLMEIRTAVIDQVILRNRSSSMAAGIGGSSAMTLQAMSSEHNLLLETA